MIHKLFGKKEIKNASWIVGGKVFQMLLSFIVGLLTARYLGPSNYGTINYGLALVSFFSSICTLGINNVIIKDFSDYPYDQGKAIGSALLMRALSSLLSAIAIICVSLVLDRTSHETTIVVALCSVALLFQYFDTINQWFQSRYQSKYSTIASTIAYILFCGYRIIILALKKDIRWFAFSTSIEYIVNSICLIIAYKRNGGPALKASRDVCTRILKQSYHYILSGMMVAIYSQTDKIMLKQMLSESDVGFYSIASGLCDKWVFVLSAIIQSIYPTIIILHKTDRNQFEKKNRQLYGIVFYVSVVVSILFCMFGNIGIKILYGEAYLPAVMPLRIITWYTAFSYLGVARNAWIVCEGHQKYLKYMYFSAAIINVFLNIIFIPVLGATGAAFASLITQVFTSIIIPLFIKDMRPNAFLMLQAITLKDVRYKLKNRR